MPSILQTASDFHRNRPIQPSAPQRPGDIPGSVERNERYRFVHGDICDEGLVERVLSEEKPDAIVHFAAESHVDRSILSPEPVIQTNLRGTFTLLEGARRHRIARFVHVSTDEVPGPGGNDRRPSPA